MRSITECFDLIKKEIQDLNYSLFDRFQEPSDSKLIKKIEFDLKLKFNEELKERYSCSNGSSLDLDTPIGKLCYIPIYIFMSLQDATEYYRKNISGLQYLFTASSIKEPSFKIFPVFQDGGGASYWVDLNIGSANCNKILWIPIPGEEPEYQFDSLTNMMNVICDCYLKKIIYIDQDGFLCENIEEFSLIANKYNPEVKYWKI